MRYSNSNHVLQYIILEYLFNNDVAMIILVINIFKNKSVSSKYLNFFLNVRIYNY